MAEPLSSADLDRELTLWLDTTDSRPREMIVEARVPMRHVRLASGTNHRIRPLEVITEEGPSRAEVLEKLQHDLTEIIGRKPHILSSAAAIPLIADREQLRRILSLPNVKAVRVNRRLR